MGGYVDRAQLLLAHKTPADPRVLTMYPPGTHSLLALEFLALGRDSRHAIGVAHALVGAIPAPCLAALTLNLRREPGLPAALVGRFGRALVPARVLHRVLLLRDLVLGRDLHLHAWLTVRDWKGPVGRLAVGVAAATAFFVRPQFILAWALDLVPRAFRLTWFRGPVRTAARTLASVPPVPVVLTMASSRASAFTSLRGHWGLISESALNRLWADTDVCQLKSTWKTPNGETWSYWFSPPSKPAHKPANEVRFEGYIADPVILERIRRERLRGVSVAQMLMQRQGTGT